MKRINFVGGGYTAPAIKELNVRCEAGFAHSIEIEGLTPVEGEWDE